MDRGGGVKGTGGEGVGNFLGPGLYQNLLYFTDFTLFLCTSIRVLGDAESCVPGRINQRPDS